MTHRGMLSVVLVSLSLLGIQTVAYGSDQLGTGGVAEAVSNDATDPVDDAGVWSLQRAGGSGHRTVLDTCC